MWPAASLSGSTKLFSLICTSLMIFAIGCLGGEKNENVTSRPQETEQQQPAQIAVGLPAPDFSATTLDGKTFRLSDHRGQYVLIDFWGSWCKPCLGEIPFLKEARQTLPAKHFQIVSIALDNPATLKSFIKDHEMNWIHIQQDFGGPILSLYNVVAFPTTFFIDPTGVILASGIELRHRNLGRTLRKFIKEAS